MTAVAALAAAHARRNQSIRAGQGPIALVRTAWVTGRMTLDEAPGVWEPTTSGDALAFTAALADAVTLDGRPVDGTVEVPITVGPRGIVVFSPTCTATVIERDGTLAVRIWDTASPRATSFTGIDSYPYSPEWVCGGRFEPASGGISFQHGKVQGGEVESVSPGTVYVTIAGEEYALLGLESGHRLQIVFADETTGSETYEAGRFLFVEPAADGTVVLDFNRAVVPPCSMSDQFNCPMPPAANRIRASITAGEQWPRFDGGATRSQS